MWNPRIKAYKNTSQPRKKYKEINKDERKITGTITETFTDSLDVGWNLYLNNYGWKHLPTPREAWGGPIRVVAFPKWKIFLK